MQNRWTLRKISRYAYYHAGMINLKIRPFPIFFNKLLLLLLFSHLSIAQAEIRVGMSTALSGPLKAVGNDVVAGVNAYFNRINAEGGINGELLRLIVKDDGYEPLQAAPNMRELIDDENVIAVIGNLGTPTAIVTVPIAIEKQVPFIGAITGAPLLRPSPPSRYIFNYRASYSEEVENMINGLLQSGIKPEEIAFFTQRDGYGDATYEGAISALVKHGFTQAHALAHGRYTRNSLNVEGGLATILDVPITPKAIIMAGGYAPSAKFIKLAKQDLPDCLFVNVSFVGSIALMRELGNETRNVIITEVVPDFKSDLSIAQDYRKDLSVWYSEHEPSFVSFEGYIIAKIFVEAIRVIDNSLDHESLVNSLHNLSNLDIGLGLNISFSKKNHQAIHKVWPMLMSGKEFIPVIWSDLQPQIELAKSAKN